jgi:hypothetical protein
MQNANYVCVCVCEREKFYEHAKCIKTIIAFSFYIVSVKWSEFRDKTLRS